MTSDSGAAIVRFSDRAFVVVEVEPESIQSPAGRYEVTDPEEAAALRDALDDTDNPSFTTDEAMKYLQAKRMTPGRRG